MRELQLWAGEDDLQETFRDIEVLAKQCRFKDCSHNTESGCAVKAAVNRGEIDPARLDSLHKLRKELNYLVLNYINSHNDVLSLQGLQHSCATRMGWGVRYE